MLPLLGKRKPEMCAKSSKSMNTKEMLKRVSSTPQRKMTRVGRNDPCPCGSGKKYKDCHIKEGEAFLDKLTRKQELDRELEAMKKSGAPWWKRFIKSLSSR